MDLAVFSAVLFSALLHATWNTLARGGGDPFTTIVTLCLMQIPIVLVVLLWSDLPAWQCWPWLLIGIVLHFGYNVFLIQSYIHGDMSQVYPLARGASPLIVAIAGAVLLNERLSVEKTLAILLIGGGVIAMSLRGGVGFTRMPRRAISSALLSAAFTAAYTIVDGIGTRKAGSPGGYMVVLIVGESLCVGLYACAMRGRAAICLPAATWMRGAAAASIALASYGIFLWALTQAPLAYAAALRETSVLFAMLIATLILRELVSPWRWGAALMILSGIVLMRL